MTRACAPRTAAAHPGLRGLVAGYAGFGRPGARPVPHRLLALAATAIIVDVAAGTAVVTGPRTAGGVCAERAWGHGVLIALTPLGVPELLGVPARDLVDLVLPRAWVARLPAGSRQVRDQEALRISRSAARRASPRSVST